MNNLVKKSYSFKISKNLFDIHLQCMKMFTLFPLFFKFWIKTTSCLRLYIFWWCTSSHLSKRCYNHHHYITLSKIRLGNVTHTRDINNFSFTYLCLCPHQPPPKHTYFNVWGRMLVTTPTPPLSTLLELPNGMIDYVGHVWGVT